MTLFPPFLIDGTPSARFSTMIFELHDLDPLRTIDRLRYRATTSLLDAKGPLARTRSIVEVLNPNGTMRHAVTDTSVRLAGLFDAVLLSQKHQVPKVEIRLLATGIDQVEGSLFPLAADRRISFRMQRLRQTSIAGRAGRAFPEVALYACHVGSIAERYDASSPPVPGPIVVLECEERSIEGVDRVEIHYAPSIAARVLERRVWEDGNISELRLVSWRGHDPSHGYLSGGVVCFGW